MSQGPTEVGKDICHMTHLSHDVCASGLYWQIKICSIFVLLLKLPLSRTVVVTTCADGTQQISSSGALLSLPLVLILCFT